MKLNVFVVFAVVTAAALAGMLLGAGFGFAAGNLSPDMFEHFIMWAKLDPVPTAVVLGATAGVVCGGGLAVFGIIVQVVCQAIAGRKSRKD